MVGMNVTPALGQTNDYNYYMSVFSVKLANGSLRLYLETTVYPGPATYVNHLGA